MRTMMLAAAVVMAACATQAQAQTNEDRSGTWAFQTAPYGTQQVGVIMSGVAVVSAVAPDRYDIRLLANERLINRMTGETQLLTARQTCSGVADGPVFNITCELAEPLEGYAPDNFLLQAGENADQLVGALDSAASTDVTFTRLR